MLLPWDLIRLIIPHCDRFTQRSLNHTCSYLRNYIPKQVIRLHNVSNLYCAKYLNIPVELYGSLAWDFEPIEIPVIRIVYHYSSRGMELREVDGVHNIKTKIYLPNSQCVYVVGRGEQPHVRIIFRYETPDTLKDVDISLPKQSPIIIKYDTKIIDMLLFNYKTRIIGGEN